MIIIYILGILFAPTMLTGCILCANGHPWVGLFAIIVGVIRMLQKGQNNGRK